MYVGVDVCKAHLDVYFHPFGEALRVANDRTSVTRLKPEVACSLNQSDDSRQPTTRTCSAHGSKPTAPTPGCWLSVTRRPRRRHRGCPSRSKRCRSAWARDVATTERTALVNRLAASQTVFLKSELKRRIKSLEKHIAGLNKEIKRRIDVDPALARCYLTLQSIFSVGSKT